MSALSPLLHHEPTDWIAPEVPDFPISFATKAANYDRPARRSPTKTSPPLSAGIRKLSLPTEDQFYPEQRLQPPPRPPSRGRLPGSRSSGQPVSPGSYQVLFILLLTSDHQYPLDIIVCLGLFGFFPLLLGASRPLSRVYIVIFGLILLIPSTGRDVILRLNPQGSPRGGKWRRGFLIFVLGFKVRGAHKGYQESVGFSALLLEHDSLLSKERFYRSDSLEESIDEPVRKKIGEVSQRHRLGNAPD